MVYPPFSPPMHPQVYNSQYTSMRYIASQASSLKRKRTYDDEFVIGTDEAGEGYHNRNKKHQVDVRPLTPTSPPSTSSVSSIQTLSPPSNDVQYLYQPVKQDIAAFDPYISQNNCTAPPSDAHNIPSQNLFLRDIHMKSRIYMQHQTQPPMSDDKDEEMDEEMWEEEEEIVAERYAAMNKLLGSRRMHWQ